MHTLTNTYIHSHSETNTYTHTHTDIRTHTYTYTLTHIQKYAHIKDVCNIGFIKMYPYV